MQTNTEWERLPFGTRIICVNIYFLTQDATRGCYCTIFYVYIYILSVKDALFLFPFLYEVHYCDTPDDLSTVC